MTKNRRVVTATPLESPPLAICETGTARGRGVFAQRGFEPGEVVETAPVLVLRCDFDDLPELLKTYVFDWENLTGVPRSHAVSLGYGSMYNHANPSSLRYEADARGAVMRYIAVRRIEVGEELTINYSGDGGHHEAEDDHWFERHDIALIKD
ncbi:MAG: SET domain-containing protein-lysine N-methyltransferase [Rubrivivax sp.]|nr:SET domain-containing protein-lysine N-methyltransferase [Rubrivivax sp.]